MKKIVLYMLSLLALTLVACNEEKLTDPTVMPEATAKGAQTFGCLVDGWIYAGGRYTDNYGNFESKPSIVFTVKNTVPKTIDVSVKVRRYEYIRFKIVNPVAGQECTFTDAKYVRTVENETAANDTPLAGGKVQITRFDDTIISGTFSSDAGSAATGIISEGRFDVNYLTAN